MLRKIDWFDPRLTVEDELSLAPWTTTKSPVRRSPLVIAIVNATAPFAAIDRPDYCYRGAALFVNVIANLDP